MFAAAPDSGMTRCVDAEADASVVLFDRYEPLLFLAWWGRPSVALLDQVQEWLDLRIKRARARGDVLVLVGDVTHSGMPSADARRRMATLGADTDVVLKLVGIVPISNPLIKGAMESVIWILGEHHRRSVVSSYEHAIDIARETLGSIGLELPADLPADPPTRWARTPKWPRA